jgi:hypothetical protein
MKSQVSIIIPTTLADASQLTCLQHNVSIPAPPLLDTPSLSTCSISSFIKNGDNLLSSCCNTTDHVVVSPYIIPTSNDLVMTGGYTADGCDWAYCNVTGQSGIEEFESCLRATAPEVKAQCYSGGKAQTSDARRQISVPWKKTEKKTLSAGLLIALGVAGMFMG